MTDNPKPKRTKVALVGFASSSRDQAPYTDDSFDIVSLNHAYTFIPRWDVWYELHARAHFQKDLQRDGQAQDGQRHVEWMKKEPAGGRPIYMQEHFDDIPASVRFPRLEINEWLRRNGVPEGELLPDGYFVDDYYTSSIAPMLVMAIYQGYEEIHLYGIDLLQAEEYFYQRSGAEYYVGFARGRGIKVYIPPTSALCKSNYVYGYGEPPTDIEAVQPFVDHLQRKIDEMAANKHKVIGLANTLDGGIQMANLILGLKTKRVVQRNDKGEPILGPDGKALLRDATTDDLFGECEAQIKRLSEQNEQAKTNIVALDGQAAAFQCSKSWIEHHARGGKLA